MPSSALGSRAPAAAPHCRDVDVDYDVGMENAGRYGTRANRQMATRAGATRAQVRHGQPCGWGRAVCTLPGRTRAADPFHTPPHPPLPPFHYLSPSLSSHCPPPQDPKKRQQQMGRPEAYPALPGGGGAMMGRAGQRAQPGAVQGVLWTKQEDELLLAITHEFGVNWTMVGAHLRPHACPTLCLPARACFVEQCRQRAGGGAASAPSAQSVAGVEPRGAFHLAAILCGALPDRRACRRVEPHSAALTPCRCPRC